MWRSPAASIIHYLMLIKQLLHPLSYANEVILGQSATQFATERVAVSEQIGLRQ